MATLMGYSLIFAISHVCVTDYQMIVVRVLYPGYVVTLYVCR